MINKGVNFRQIENQSQNLRDFAIKTFIVVSHASVTAVESSNGHSSMTIEQVWQLST